MVSLSKASGSGLWALAFRSGWKRVLAAPALVAGVLRQKKLGVPAEDAALQQARAWLAGEQAQKAGVAGLLAALG